MNCPSFLVHIESVDNNIGNLHPISLEKIPKMSFYNKYLKNG